MSIPEKISDADRIMVTDEPPSGSAIPTGTAAANADLP